MSALITSWIDLDILEETDLLDEATQGRPAQLKASEAWSPYTSKTVS